MIPFACRTIMNALSRIRSCSWRPDGRLWLLFTAQRFGNQDTAIVRYRTSEDGGRSWNEIGTLIDRPGTFVRQPPTHRR